MAKKAKASVKPSVGTVWLLVDQYVGNSNQARAMARLMGWPEAKEHMLEYSRFAQLPNFMQFGLSSLTRSCAAKLRQADEPPSIIISAGRRAACVAVALKKQYPKARLIQIMGPQCGFHHFSMVILPEHDRKSWVRYPKNVFFHHGAIVHFDQKVLQGAAKQLKNKLKHQGPFVTLLIGGSTKRMPFTVEQFRQLWDKASKCASEIGAMLLISSSRRTPPIILSLLEQELKSSKIPHYYYAYGSKEPNPYLGMLGLGDYLLITADSISMCSECCATGKPTYIYAPDAIKGSKHWRFIQGLIVASQAAALTTSLFPLPKNADADAQQLIEGVSEALGL